MMVKPSCNKICTRNLVHFQLPVVFGDMDAISTTYLAHVKDVGNAAIHFFEPFSCTAEFKFQLSAV